MTVGTALTTSFLVTLARPTTWILALATFLVRGGFLLVLAPIVELPSAAGLANVAAPFVVDVVLGIPTPALVLGVTGLIAAWLAWLVGGGLVAATVEAEAIRIVASDDDIAAVSGGRAALAAAGSLPAERVARRILAARLLAHLPTALAISWGAVRIVTVAYRELTVPSEVTTPVALRIALGASEAIAVIAIAWLLAEVVGTLAARRIALGGDGVGRSLVRALGWLGRHPAIGLGATLIPLAALIAVIGATAAAASVGWIVVRASLTAVDAFLGTLLALVVFVALWGGGLVLLGAVSAWRGAAFTVAAAGTFGSPVPDRPGDWNDGTESGTLTDLRPRGVEPDTR